MVTAAFQPLTAAGCAQGWCFLHSLRLYWSGVSKVLPCFFLNTDHTLFCNLLFTEISFPFTEIVAYAAVCMHMMLCNWRRAALENLMAELCCMCRVGQLLWNILSFFILMLYICKVVNVSDILLKPCNAVNACKASDTKALSLCVHLHNTGFLIHLRGSFAWEKDILLSCVNVGLLQVQRRLLLQRKAVFLQGRQNCVKIDKSSAAFKNWSDLPWESSIPIRISFLQFAMSSR